MQYWQKDRDYRKCINADGSVSYIITVDGVDVEVSSKVYRVYSQVDRRERYCCEREDGLLLSLERLDEDGVPLGNMMSQRVPSAEDIVLHRLLTQAALDALSRLTPEEQRLIRAVVMEGMPEQVYADVLGVSQVAVHKRKHRLLKKLLQLMGY